MDDGGYKVGFIITAVITFLSAWAYCTIEYGFLWGFGFGWVPSAILAVIAGFIWPLIAIAAGIFIVGLILMFAGVLDR